MDLSLDILSRSLEDSSIILPNQKILEILNWLESSNQNFQKLNRLKKDFFFVFLQKNKEFKDEMYYLMLLLSGHLCENNILSQDDKIKLEVLHIISQKFKENKPDIMNLTENFVFITLHSAIILKITPILQDFNEVHKKIKQKMQEDMRYYLKFLENSITIANNPIFTTECSQIQIVFLSNFCKIIKKTPFLLKNITKSMFQKLINLLKVPYSNKEFLKKVEKTLVLMVFFLENCEKPSIFLENILSTLLFLLRICSSNNNQAVDIDDFIQANPFLLQKEELFTNNEGRVLTMNLMVLIRIFTRMIKKSIKIIRKQEKISLEIPFLIKNCEEIISLEPFTTNSIALLKGFSDAEEAKVLLLKGKREILKILRALCEKSIVYFFS